MEEALDRLVQAWLINSIIFPILKSRKEVKSFKIKEKKLLAEYKN